MACLTELCRFKTQNPRRFRCACSLVLDWDVEVRGRSGKTNPSTGGHGYECIDSLRICKLLGTCDAS